jgi:hypothetical protein
MKRIALTILISLAPTAAVPAQPSYWMDPKGEAVPETESLRSKSGFGGWLLVTSDQDWEAKWNTPRESVPSFTEAKRLKRGESVFVLIFLGNPGVGPGTAVDVSCDIKLTRPNGTISADHKRLPCLKRALTTDPRSVFVSAPVIKFTGESAGPLGAWIVDVILHDNVARIELPLRTTFSLEP